MSKNCCCFMSNYVTTALSRQFIFKTLHILADQASVGKSKFFG